MKNILKPLLLFTMLIVSIFLLNFCKEDDKIVNPDDNNSPAETNTGIIVGTVTDVNNQPIADAVISAVGKNAKTNSQGYFTLEGLNAAEKLLVNISKEGYVITQKILSVSVGESSHLAGKLMLKGGSGTISGGTGGNLEIQGVKYQIPENSFTNSTGTPYTGTVSMNSTYFDPSSAAFTDLFPGDFEGVSQSGGTPSPIESYGFVDAEPTAQDGAALIVASGKFVNIKLPIAPSMQANAPQTISLFYYNMDSGEWIEEGTATKVDNYYEGNVSHFTSWNYDKYYDITFLEGRVIDGDGNPIVGVRVEAKGIDYTGVSYRYTKSDGTFRLGVRPNSHVEVVAKKGGITSEVLTINPTGANQETQNIGDIVLAPPIGTITLTWEEMPEDLDSHLLIPGETSGSSGGHVYFGTKGSKTIYPFAQLDTDDTDGFGPEIITIYRKYPGTYTYFVHNFDSYDCDNSDNECDASGYLVESGATVNLVIGGSAYSFNVPDSNPENKIVWRIFEINVNNEGEISINQFNDFVNLSDVLTTSPLLKK